MSFAVSRRSALAGAGWLGGLALAGRQAQPAAGALPDMPATTPAAGPETLAVWTRISHGGGDARISLVPLDARSPPGPVLAEQTIPAARIRSVAALHRTGREVARLHVAQAWGIPADECRIEHAAITDGRRRVNLIEWIDYV